MHVAKLLFRIVPFAALALPVLAESKGNDAGRNAFVIEAVAPDRYEIRFRMPDYVLHAEDIQASVDGATRRDRSGRDLLPAFSHMLELDAGRYAKMESLTENMVITVPAEGREGFVPDEKIVTIDLARMRSRVFLRVEVRPFQPDPETDQWRIYESIDAVVGVSETQPPIRDQEEPVMTRMTHAESEDKEVPCRTCPPPMPIGVSAGSGGTPSDFAPNRSVANGVAWKVTISEPGLYRITGADLEQAGVPASYRNTALLRMTVRDQHIPIWTSGAGSMQSDDGFVFYAAAVQSSYTTNNVYWLTVGDASPAPDLLNAEPGSDPPVTTTWAHVEYAPKNIYAPAYNPLNDTYDHWFALNVAGGTTEVIPFATPYPVQTGDVHLDYSLHGLRRTDSVNPDHRSILRVGSEQVAAIDYNGQVRVEGRATAHATELVDGTTNVSVEQVVLSGVDAMNAGAYVESLSLCYERQLVTDDLPFFFRGPLDSATLHVRLQNREETNLWVLDVSDPFSPKQFTGYTLTMDDGSTVLTFQDTEGGGRCLAVFTEQNISTPSAIDLVRFRNLADPGRQADYLVVTPRDFRDPIFRLLTHRYKNGLTVQVATPEDLYNEFSFGVVDPVAIRQYFGYAYHHYQRDEPRYALLVGAGSEDPLDNLGHAEPNIIPTTIGWAPIIRTALEQWFVTVDGADPLPDLALGRIPASSVSEVENAVDKIIAFETAPADEGWRETALLVADRVDSSLGIDFKEHVDGTTRLHLENGGFMPFSIGTAYRDDLTQAHVRQAIQGALDNGVHFIHYMGHGSVTQWASPGVWNLADTANSENSVYPIVAVFTCRSGAFHIPTVSALGEALVMSSAAASACVAPTGLSDQIHAEALADGFYQALAVDREPRLGDALMEGFFGLWNAFPAARELCFYTIFGDPAQSVWGGAVP